MYSKGSGVAKNEQKAAEQEYDDAYFSLGLMYEFR